MHRSNILLYSRYPWHHRLSETATTIVICADIFQLALLVYFTGGLSNPFVMLFIVPIAISISNLPLRSTSILIVFTLALISVLGFFHYPLIQEDMTYLVNPPILIIGIWISLLVTILFLSAYMGSLTRESREVAGALNVTEELLSNEQNLSSLDGLAAAAAHQLGTPLGTINLIASELMKNEKISKEGKEDLEVLLQEINKCKNILSSLGEKSSLEILSRAKKPVVFSHSNPKSLVDIPRAITDNQIKKCAATGGIIGVTNWGPLNFKKSMASRPTIENYIESIKYIKSWSRIDKIHIVYLPSPISTYLWNEPIIFYYRDLSEGIKTTSNEKNNLNSLFIRDQIKNFSKYFIW